MKSIILFLIVVVSTSLGMAQDELGRPAARTPDQDAVTESFARQVALNKAQEVWGPGAMGEPISCADDNGVLVAFMFPYRRGTDRFPTDAELFADEQAAWAARSSGGPVAPQAVHAAPPATPDKAALAASPVTPSHDPWKTDLYGTIVVSARTRDFPIPNYFNTLPPYFVTVQAAAEVARKQLGTAQVKLEKYYFLGHRGEYYEFSSTSGMVLVDARHLRVQPEKQVLVRKGETAADLQKALAGLTGDAKQSYEIYTAQTQAEWQRLRQELGNK